MKLFAGSWPGAILLKFNRPSEPVSPNLISDFLEALKVSAIIGDFCHAGKPGSPSIAKIATIF
jgi:hypothetical protein